MGAEKLKITPFFLSIAFIFTATVAIVLMAVSCGGNVIVFEADYYFVCYSVEDNAVSADSISGAVSSYGGAGYILGYGDEYYVTVACYYDKDDAERVRSTLFRRGLECIVLKVETEEYALSAFNSKENKQKFLGNLNTLHTLSTLAYKCANGLDTGSYSQSAAKSVLADIKSGLNGLKNANSENCFTGEIRRLISECDSFGNGYIYSKDMRKLQIAIADTIINIKLY